MFTRGYFGVHGMVDTCVELWHSELGTKGEGVIMIIKLGEALDKKDMSAADLAKELGVSPKQMSRLFRGDVDPRVGDIMKWARILNTKVKTLLEDDGKNTITVTRPTTALESIKMSKVKNAKNKVIKKKTK